MPERVPRSGPDVSFYPGPHSELPAWGKTPTVKCKSEKGHLQLILLPGHSRAKSCGKKPPRYLFKIPVTYKHLLSALGCWASSGNRVDRQEFCHSCLYPKWRVPGCRTGPKHRGCQAIDLVLPELKIQWMILSNWRGKKYVLQSCL